MPILGAILPHIVIEAVVFGFMILTALGGLSYAWWRRRFELKKDTLPIWRQIAASIGLLAVTAQALLFILFFSWTRIGREYTMFGQWARWVIPTFLVAAPCVLAWRGPSRWWLLSSSVLLFTICFLIVLSA